MREKFAAVSTQTDIFPLATLKHTKEDACRHVAVAREIITLPLAGCWPVSATLLKRLLMYEALVILVFFGDVIPTLA